jgi:uncharacterized protein (TIGR02145 family)
MNTKLFWMITVFALALSSCKKETQEAPIQTGTVKDIEGNVYKTVLLGGKWWMAENLKVTKFNDGTEIKYIPIFSSDTLWANCTDPCFTFLNDSIYGCLYNQSAIQGDKKLAPSGWHVATDEDWKDLERFIGMSNDEVGAFAWRGTDEAEDLLPNYSEGWPTNSVPFGNDRYQMKILPAGCKTFNGIASVNANMAFFWTSTLNGSEAWYRYFDAKKKSIFRQLAHVQYGMSVRCVKD